MSWYHCFVVALSIVQLIDSHAIRNVRSTCQTEQCTQYYLDLLKETAQKTSITPHYDKSRYCFGAGRRSRSAVFVDEIDLDSLIAMYSSFPRVNSYSSSGGPLVSYGVLPVPDNDRVPVYMIADIRRSHLLPSSARPAFGDDVAEQMRLMGQQSSDERGHLLAHSLGGYSTALNIVPMARNLNRHIQYRSFWRSNEDWIRRFLLNYPNGRVSWRLVVHYDDDVVACPNAYHSYRPRAFTLQYTAYTNADDDNTVYYRTGVLTYINDNDYYCDDNLSRRRRSTQTSCDVRLPKELRGVMGEEKSRGKWNQKYEVAFPFTIAGTHFFYSQSIADGHNWFIQELFPNGHMGEETDHGFLDENYHTAFPFFINGRNFFFGQSLDSYNWVIRELLPYGKMGPVRSRGRWNQRYQVSVPFTIDGVTYFYGQSIIDGHNWFIQELLPEGLMGAETCHGFFDDKYPVAVPFLINGRQFLYLHSHETKRWVIREILPAGKMGKELASGKWNQKYKVSFPFQFKGKYYFYGQSILGGHNWFIQELLETGQLGQETSHGFLDENYPVAFPFQIGDKQYFYGHSTEKTWIIREIL